MPRAGKAAGAGAACYTPKGIADFCAEQKKVGVDEKKCRSAMNAIDHSIGRQVDGICADAAFKQQILDRIRHSQRAAAEANKKAKKQGKQPPIPERQADAPVPTGDAANAFDADFIERMVKKYDDIPNLPPEKLRRVRSGRGAETRAPAAESAQPESVSTPVLPSERGCEQNDAGEFTMRCNGIFRRFKTSEACNAAHSACQKADEK